MCLYMEKGKLMPYTKHLSSYKSLITAHEDIRAGFISLALEKNKEATPFIEEAKALKIIAGKAIKPNQLIEIKEIQESLLTASGISEKAKKYLKEKDKKQAIRELVESFLDPAGKHFIDELVYRFLLTKGDTLGGIIRNLAGTIGERKFTRTLISTLFINNKNFTYFDKNSRTWIKVEANKQKYESDLEKRVKGLHWLSEGRNRVLMYNLTIPMLKKNVDLCLLDGSPKEILSSKKNKSAHQISRKYMALGELKGGIDPAGADEHWKTANSALERIRKAFLKQSCKPKTFFIGAAIEKAMAQEIYQQLKKQTLTNSANLTNKPQLISLCTWLINL